MDNNKNKQPPKIVGGGVKKVLYTLNTVRRMGLINSGKALTSNNTCKACGLGMGGQKGGMVNEVGDYPSVCNKSIQAQSTDIQPPIPNEIFAHTIEDLKELSGREMEKLGRLNTPLYKAAESNTFSPVDWDWAISHTAQHFNNAEPGKTFFYSSGRSSNEAGFILQLLARIYGTNNVNNCSYYCHQATGVGMTNTIGTGTATVELNDLSGCDLIFVIGANPASNHPRFIYQLKGCRDRGGQVVVINPAKEPGLVKFAVPKSAKSMLSGGSEIASEYIQPHIGSDLALLTGISKALIENNDHDADFIDQYCQDFSRYKVQLDTIGWDWICSTTGIDQNTIEQIAARYAQANNVVFAWGMGITHHRNGVENVEAIVNLALLRGMVGKPYAGLLPLRGHSNVQGIGTIGVKPVLPQDVFNKLEETLDINLPKQKGMDTLACLEAAHQAKIQAALFMGGNLYQASPDSSWTQQALDRIPFKVYLTTTLNLGHIHGVENSETIILPVTARDEEWQSTTQESMFNFVRMSDGGIQRIANPRPESDILCSLAEKIIPENTFSFKPFNQHKHVREAIAATIPGMKQLKNIDQNRSEFHINGRIKHTPTFDTANNKAHFAIHSIPFMDICSDSYPIRLSSIRSEGQFNSIIYEEKDSYRGTTHRWVVLMSRETARLHGLEMNVPVIIESEHGKMCEVQIHEFDLPTSNVMAYYPEANILIGREADPRSKTPAFKSVAVRIYQ